MRINPSKIGKVPANKVEAGSYLWKVGHIWRVEANRFDPHGNTGNQPRQLMSCVCVSELEKLAGPGYVDSNFGFGVDEEIELLDPSEVEAVFPR